MASTCGDFVPSPGFAMRELRILCGMPAMGRHRKQIRIWLRRSTRRRLQKERIQPMDFFKILNIAGTILAWVIVLAVVWAAAPYIVKLYVVVQSIHNFAK